MSRSCFDIVDANSEEGKLPWMFEEHAVEVSICLGLKMDRSSGMGVHKGGGVLLLCQSKEKYENLLNRNMMDPASISRLPSPSTVPSSNHNFGAKLSPTTAAHNMPYNTPLTPINRDLWVKDHVQSGCSVCRKEFTFFRRRHHCRACGGLVCGDCSETSTLLRDRVCAVCYAVEKDAVDRMAME